MHGTSVRVGRRRAVSWPTSPLDAVERAFEVLLQSPVPLALDGSLFVGLPARSVSLREVRRTLLAPQTGVALRDAVWAELVRRSRHEGPTWVVAALGMAMPGLRRRAGQLAAGWRGDADDLDAELVAGFVARLRTVDVDGSRICGRLIDAALRAGRLARQRGEGPDVLSSPPAGPALPARPWDHPDLVLARAVAAGVLDTDEARLVGATRLGEATLAQCAQVLGISVALAAAWRLRAERRLVEAIHAGELTFVLLRERPRPV